MAFGPSQPGPYRRISTWQAQVRGRPEPFATAQPMACTPEVSFGSASEKGAPAWSDGFTPTSRHRSSLVKRRQWDKTGRVDWVLTRASSGAWKAVFTGGRRASRRDDPAV